MQKKIGNQRQEQLELKLLESERIEREKELKENEIKTKVSQWIKENPEKYESLVEEEKERLGEAMASEIQAKILAR